MITLALFPVVSLATWVVRPGLYDAIAARPPAWLAVAVVLGGAWAVFTGVRGTAERRAFAGSCAVMVGLLSAAAIGVFPVMLHSTLGAEYSMTVYNGAAPARSLALALMWWPVAFVLAFSYFIAIMRDSRGKVRAAEDAHGSY